MKNKIFKTIAATLDKDGIRYDIDDNKMFHFEIQGDHSKFDVILVCEEKMEFMMTIVTSSMCVPKDKIDKMCRWIVQKNYGLLLGEFKMDPSDGEFSFRITCPLDKGAVNETIVKVSYSTALSVFDNSYEEIVKAIYSDGKDNWALVMADAAKHMKEAQENLDFGTEKRINS